MIWKTFSALVIFSVCLGDAAAQEKAKLPKPIPEKETTAWVTAGGLIGRMGELVPGVVRFQVRDNVGPGQLPAFRFDDWPPRQKLSALPAITVPFGLDLHRLKLGDADVKELARLKNLRFLRLDDTRVTDAGVKHLAGLSGLQALDLGKTQVSDKGLKELARLENLQFLLLDGTKVTDKGLNELKSLKSLRSLNLHKTAVTKEGIGRLKKALPLCRIVPDK